MGSQTPILMQAIEYITPTATEQITHFLRILEMGAMQDITTDQCGKANPIGSRSL